jgi:hypothetical protein
VTQDTVRVPDAYYSGVKSQSNLLCWPVSVPQTVGGFLPDVPFTIKVSVVQAPVAAGLAIWKVWKSSLVTIKIIIKS